MHTFLLTFAILGAFNAACVVWMLLTRGELPPMSQGVRLVGFMLDTAFAVWAACLLWSH